MKLSVAEINQIIACPKCKADLSAVESQDIQCKSCGETYRALPYSWDFTPPYWKESSTLWEAWEVTQTNGSVSYCQDPEHNLGVGKRNDCTEFGAFCKFDGLVLDIGCGPQAWPAYYSEYTANTRFIGIDPLAGNSESGYTQFRGLGEYLPFKDTAFSQVVFATSLDHFVDPTAVLREAVRVCKTDGNINIWIGEKSPNAPKPKISYEWYEQLVKPAEADDVFHLKRLSRNDLCRFIQNVGLVVEKEAVMQVDEYRTNYFFRLGKD